MKKVLKVVMKINKIYFKKNLISEIFLKKKIENLKKRFNFFIRILTFTSKEKVEV